MAPIPGSELDVLCMNDMLCIDRTLLIVGDLISYWKMDKGSAVTVKKFALPIEP